MDPTAPPTEFPIDWVLQGELALGPAPQGEEHLRQLEREGVGGVLSLCAPEECQLPAELGERFCWNRLVLPDHRSGRIPTPEELAMALDALARLQRQAGPVFVHCVASMERSPLLCMAWLVRRRGMAPLQALDYLMQIHPATNPLPQQLALLGEAGVERAPATPTAAPTTDPITELTTVSTG